MQLGISRADAEGSRARKDRKPANKQRNQTDPTNTAQALEIRNDAASPGRQEFFGEGKRDEIRAGTAVPAGLVAEPQGHADKGNLFPAQAKLFVSPFWSRISHKASVLAWSAEPHQSVPPLPAPSQGI